MTSRNIKTGPAPNRIGPAMWNQNQPLPLSESDASNLLSSAGKGEVCAVLVEVLRRCRTQHGWLTIEEASELAGWSVRTFQRTLAAENTSWSMLVSQVRYQLARELLVETDRTMAEIAHALGYSNLANFDRAFHRWAETTPTQFRKQNT